MKSLRQVIYRSIFCAKQLPKSQLPMAEDCRFRCPLLSLWKHGDAKPPEGLFDSAK
jgi:hypothetical protein